MFMNKNANSIEKLFEKYIAMAEGEGTSFENPNFSLSQTPGEMMIMETKQLLSFQTGHPRQLLANTKLMSEKK